MRKFEYISIGIIIFFLIINLLLYPLMPERIATHWGTKGEVNGYMTKFWGLFLLPIITGILFLILLLIPKIDPLRKNIDSFKNYYSYFILAFVIFMFYIHILTLLWNLGLRFNMSTMMLPAIGILFFFIGILLKKIKRNWFIGIRTPWTLSNDNVWKKTHLLGSKLFKISGVIMFIGLFFDEYLLFIILLPVIISSVWLVIYSYLEFVKENKTKR